MLQCCPLHPYLAVVASGIGNLVFSAWCNADRCMLHFRYVLSFPHVAMLPVACCNAARCMLSALPVACCNAVRCNLSCCLLHLELGILSFSHGAMLQRCMLSALPVACCNVVRCNLSCCLWHLELNPVFSAWCNVDRCMLSVLCLLHVAMLSIATYLAVSFCIWNFKSRLFRMVPC